MQNTKFNIMVKYKITFTTVCSLLLVWLIKVYADDVILQIAREYRDGTSNIRSNIGRAARYYEVIIDQVNTVSTDAEIAIAAIELAYILEEDPTIFSNHSYLELLMRAAEAGNGDAQHRLSVMYATGVAARDLIPMDSGRAIFLEYMSALSGNPIANMGMAYRYSYGIGLVKSCEKALPFYEYAANHVAEYIEARGNMQYPDKRKLSDATSQQQQKEGSSQELTEYYSHLADGGDDMAALMLGNMYLSGTRVVSMNETTAIKYLRIAADKHNIGASGILGYTLIKKYIKSIENYYVKGAVRMKYTELEGIIALLQLSAEKHEVNGVVGLSLAEYHGVGVTQNISHAIERLYNFMSVHADAGFYLGEICMGMKPLSYTDEVIPKSYKLHHKHGYATIELNEDGAMQAYMISAQLGNTLAQHRLGHLFLGRGAGRGPGQGRSNSGTTITQKAANCANAMKHFKSVAERGPWMGRLRTAQQYYSEGKHRAALFEFIQLAAVGVEIAQYNAAFMLSKCGSNCPPNDNNNGKIHTVTENTVAETNLGKLLKYLKEMNEHHTTTKDGNIINSIESVVYINNMTIWKGFIKSYEPQSLSILATPFTIPSSSSNEGLSVSHSSSNTILSKEIKRFRRIESETRALILFDLSAIQGNAESYLLLGDIYYYNKAGLIENEIKKQAAGFYRQAAEMRETQAIFNLGLMHQAGDGVAQDFHLAKRYYDQAANFDHSAKVPRDIALFMLEGHKVLNTWFGIETYSQILETKIYIPTLILKYYCILRSKTSTNTNYYQHSNKTYEWFTIKDVFDVFYQLDVQFQEKLDYFINKYHEVIVFPINYYTRNFFNTISFYCKEFMNYFFPPTKHHIDNSNYNDQDRNDATTILYEIKRNSKKIKTQEENNILSKLIQSIENIYKQSRNFLISLRIYIGKSTLTVEQYEQFFSKEEFLVLFSTIILLVLLISIKIIRRQIIITFQQRNN